MENAIEVHEVPVEPSTHTQIKECLGASLSIRREKQKVFIATQDQKPIAVFVTSNEKPEVIYLHPFISKTIEIPDLSEAIKILTQLLPNTYPEAKNIIMQITDNNGIIKQALGGEFHVSRRILELTMKI